MASHRKPYEDLDMQSGLSGHQQHQAARVVASASVDAADCARLLAALGLEPADWSSSEDRNH
jgi:lysophospholipid acyltransferase (LPLAT)-like uncharacterized protein